MLLRYIQSSKMSKLIARTVLALLTLFTVCLKVGLTSEQTIDEIIAGAYSRPQAFLSDMGGNTQETVIRTDLDMLMSLEQYNVLYGKDNIPSLNNAEALHRIKRKAIKDLTLRWTNNVIPYMIDGNFNNDDTKAIYNAINEWQNNTCITFRKATIFDLNYIRFKDGYGCSSFVGVYRFKQEKRKGQPINLGEGCRGEATIIHEIGHAVGFYHEQNRPDRDNFIIVKEEHIKHEKKDNFQKYDSSVISTHCVPYDYKSIMHYGPRDFSKDGKDTIKTIDPAYQDKIGKSKGLSFQDIKLANYMYNCRPKRCKPKVRCPDGAFRGKDCRCLCQGNPVKPCVIARNG